MKNILSRRDFMVTGTVMLGTAVACELTGVAGAAELASSGMLSLKGTKGETMPHISVKLWPGRSEETKQRLADAIVADVVNIIGCDEASVSVSIEDVSSGDWKEDVYDPEIRQNRKHLYKKPGYSM